MISSGESLTWQLARQLQSAVPRARLLNIYGCCEIGADATFYDFTAAQALGTLTNLRKGAPEQQREQHHHHHILSRQHDDGMLQPASDLCKESPQISASRQSTHVEASQVVPKYVPAGRPLPPVSVRIMQQMAAKATHAGTASSSEARPETEVLLPCMADTGCEGEVWVGGPGVAAGYLGEAELTAARFLQLPPSLTTAVRPQGQVQPFRSRSSSHSQQQRQGQQHTPAPGHSASSHTVKTAACIQEDIVSLASLPAGRTGNSLLPQNGSSMLSDYSTDVLQAMGGILSSSTTDWERFFRSGDLGYVDTATGLLHITGRTDSQVKIRGEY